MLYWSAIRQYKENTITLTCCKDYSSWHNQKILEETFTCFCWIFMKLFNYFTNTKSALLRRFTCIKPLIICFNSVEFHAFWAIPSFHFGTFLFSAPVEQSNNWIILYSIQQWDIPLSPIHLIYLFSWLYRPLVDIFSSKSLAIKPAYYIAWTAWN